MQTDEFLNRVQEYGGLASRDEALRAAQATIQALGEQLGRDEADDLFAQLPADLPRSLELAVGRRGADQSVEQFLERVGQLGGVEEEYARRFARGALSALQEAVSLGMLEDVLAALPPTFDDLFTGSPANIAGGGPQASADVDDDYRIETLRPRPAGDGPDQTPPHQRPGDHDGDHDL